MVEINQLIRSRRRTIGLEITDGGQLIVRAPKRASLWEIEKLIKEKQHWILRHQQDIQQKLATLQPKKFIAGEQFLFLGNNYFLEIDEIKSSRSLQFEQKFLLTSNLLPRAPKIFIKWYREQALRILTERAISLASQHNFQFRSIRINNAKRQWGSCSRDNKLTFSWRLILAPLPVIDYVIVHELVHTVQHNHSKRFWQKVSTIVPDHKEYRRWLRQNDHLLTI